MPPLAPSSDDSDDEDSDDEDSDEEESPQDRAGGLTQQCGFCGGDNRFHAMVLFDHLDIPNTVVDARFLHRLVGYRDQQDHNPEILMVL